MYLTQCLHRSLQQYPTRMAVRHDGCALSYAQFVGRVSRLAGALQGLGMAQGDRVAMLSFNSQRYLEYEFGVAWGGGVINPCNIRWSALEIAYSLRDSGSTILMVDDSFKAMVEPILCEAPGVREVIHVGDGPPPPGMHGYEALIEASSPVCDAVRRGNDLAAIFYTGGTTGYPKGVMLSHNNLVSSGLSLLAEGIASADSVFLHVAPMFHIAAFGIGMAHHLAGGTHAVLPSFNAEAVLDSIEGDRVTDMLLVPTMIQKLVDHPSAKANRDLGSLRRIVYGASAISEAVLERAMVTLPRVEFIHAYGMTEAAPIITFNPSGSHGPKNRALDKRLSCGRATYATEVRIADADGAEVPRGIVGEIWVRGPNVMQGYWNKPEETAAALRGGWLHTGDGGYMDEDGYIFIVDRLKDMIISGGENIYSVEVENVLARHPAVAICAVIGIPCEEWGEAVHAVVVTKTGEQVSCEALQAHCRALMARYKCPRSIEFRDSLPLSGAGKILKTTLRERFWQERERQVS